MWLFEYRRMIGGHPRTAYSDGHLDLGGVTYEAYGRRRRWGLNDGFCS